MTEFAVEILWPFRWKNSQYGYLLYLIEDPKVVECFKLVIFSCTFFVSFCKVLEPVDGCRLQRDGRC